MGHIRNRRLSFSSLFILCLVCLTAIGYQSCGSPFASKSPGAGTLSSSTTISPLARLTLEELDNSTAFLLGETQLAAGDYLPADTETPFINDAETQEPNEIYVTGAEAFATNLANNFVASSTRGQYIGCTPSAASDVACFRTFINRFVRLAFRRNLEPNEVDKFVSLAVNAAQAENDFYVGVSQIVRATMQHPEFLYRIEIGVPIGQGIRRLSPAEIASRLAFLLWGAPPDTTLLNAAYAGNLSSPEGIAQQAQRMLSDSRAQQRVLDFHARWLGFYTMPIAGSLGVSLREETYDVIRSVIFEENEPWDRLFTMPESYVNDELIAHYALQDPGGSGKRWASYAGTNRKGILSHGSILTNGAKDNDTSPTRRGIFIRERLFCQKIPPPPPNVDVDAIEEPSTAGNCKKDRFVRHTAAGSSCFNCHQAIDPVGYGMEQFNRLGQFITVEEADPACPIDGQGEVVNYGNFSGPGELSEILVSNRIIQDCAVHMYYRFAFGHDVQIGERNVVAKLKQGFANSQFNFQKLIISLVTSPEFRHKKVE